MWEDEIVEELHRIREEHAREFNYDIKAICEDWRRRHRQFVTLPLKKQSDKATQQIEQK
ncbi:hypothetical protein [Leptolyngbya sp. NIES-2104]|uniref:hypothetical protein n=1 Tax=Leptolyngbya sp. NIES-2104 TaxID=1552121 RepID=UPI0006EC83A9|nr:hypothetical protein [Leptolyngbya sp. NIES-2104]GAP93636.1 hypothetical protein NIES2104_01430 [Leptolyngbya sp. NIES-2104]